MGLTSDVIGFLLQLLADFVAKVGFELGDDGVSDLSLGDCASPGRLLPGGVALWLLLTPFADHLRHTFNS